ncbi:MAG: hypothetical protein WAN03_02805 [Candidatus Sulfotelmatobacter sp.]
MTRASYGKLTAAIIAVWFAISLAASALQLFRTDPTRPPLPLLLAVVTPLVLFVLWYLSSAGFREFVLSLNPTTLTLVQAWRIAGFVFLVLYTYRLLPGALALPAGWGDIFIGATAVIVATRLADPNHRNSFIVWQLLGMTDLFTAISMGAVARFLSPEIARAEAISTAPMTVLPLSLIPTFAVPLYFILHIICLLQARQWSHDPSLHVGEPLPSVAR